MCYTFAHLVQCIEHAQPIWCALSMHTSASIPFTPCKHQSASVHLASTSPYKCVVHTMQAPFSKCVVLHIMPFTQYKHPFPSVQFTNVLQEVCNLHNASTRQVCVLLVQSFFMISQCSQTTVSNMAPYLIIML